MLVHVTFVEKNNYQQLSMPKEHKLIFQVNYEPNDKDQLAFSDAINNLKNIQLLQYDMALS